MQGKIYVHSPFYSYPTKSHLLNDMRKPGIRRPWGRSSPGWVRGAGAGDRMSARAFPLAAALPHRTRFWESKSHPWEMGARCSTRVARSITGDADQRRRLEYIALTCCHKRISIIFKKKPKLSNYSILNFKFRLLNY